MLLGGAAVFSNFTDYQRHNHGVAELERFIVLLDAANAVSAERGPANSAMTATDEDAALRRTELIAKRAETDAALSRVETEFSALLLDEDCSAAWAMLQSELRNGRQKVDLAANTAFAQRDPRAIGTGILAMFAAADGASALRDQVSGHIILETPNLAGEVMLANSTSAMRDQEGRLGSYLVMALVAPPERDPIYLQRMQTSEGVIRTLWSTSVGMADELLPDPKISELIQAVLRDYFDGVLVLARNAAEKNVHDNSLSTAELTASYLPGLRSSELLRTAVVEYSVAALHRNAQRALGGLIGSALLTSAILAVLVVVAIVFRRTLFAPLMRLQDDVLALAGGDHNEPERIPG
ncbi:MAG: hypothetical protein EOO80_18270, partial [Oxalobacteraceae bacterium]